MAKGNEHTNKRDPRRVETKACLVYGAKEGLTNTFLSLTGLPEFGLSGMGLRRLWVDPMKGRTARCSLFVARAQTRNAWVGVVARH